MAYTSTDLDRLDAAIATSELEVEVDGTRTRYRSIPELVAARAHVAAVLSAPVSAAASRRTVHQFNFSTARGD